MSETKFTPGPWEIGKGGSVVTQTPDEQVDMSEGSFPALTHYDVQDTIKFYGGHVICETVTNANAALIAAAPDLYQVVDLLLSAIAHTSGARNNTRLMEAVVDANAARTKARGDLPQS